MNLSPQQQAIIEWVRTGKGSAIVRARAGTGKTFTSIEAMKHMAGRVAYVVYNKKNAKEAERKIEINGLGRKVVSGTFHKFGFDAWRMANVRVQVMKDNKKSAEIMETLGVEEHLRKFAASAASLAKQRGFGVLCPFNDPASWLGLVEHYDLDMEIADIQRFQDREYVIQEGLRWACKLLKSSVVTSNKSIDFDDMIYMPLMGNVRMPQYDWVIVDEAQDTNPVRRALAKGMLKPGGRAIFVGDDRQAIYGFTGADNDSLDQIARDFATVNLPLTVTYRCPKRVVLEAAQIVPDYRAHDDMIRGVVETISEEMMHSMVDLGEGDVVICRNVKPLVDTAFAFIRRGIPCFVEGKEIGRGLRKLLDRFKAGTLPALKDKLDAYVEKTVAKHMAKGEEEKADRLADQADTIIAIMGSLPPGSKPAALTDKMDKLFADLPDGSRPPSIVLMSAHRSKGLEFPRVFLLGRNRYMPSKYARQEWQQVQELNLEYVAITRAMETLYFVDVEMPKPGE